MNAELNSIEKLVLKSDVTILEEEMWRSHGRDIAQVHKRVQWEVADWINEGLSLLYPEPSGSVGPIGTHEDCLQWNALHNPNVPTDMVASQWKKGELEEFKKLTSEHGWEKVVAATTLYWQEQDPDSFNRTLFKWSALLATFPAWLNKVTPEMLKQAAWERWKSTPEGAKEYQRQLDVMIDAQIRRDNPPPKPLTPEQAETKRKKAVCYEAIERALAGEQVQAPEEMKMEEFDCFPDIEGKDFRTGRRYKVSVDEKTNLLVATYD